LSTIKWATKFANTSLSAVTASASALQASIDAAEDSDGDGKLQGSELLAALQGKTPAESAAALATLEYTASYAHGDPTRPAFSKYVSGFLKAIKKADADGDGTLSLTELRTLKNRGQECLVELASASAAAVAPLEFKLNHAAKDARWVSETDSVPTFVTSAGVVTGTITGVKVLSHFATEIENSAGAELTFEKRSVSDFWAEVTTPEDPNVFSSASYATGWQTLRDAIVQSLSDLALFKIGPKEGNALATDAGSYTFLLVGKASDGKLAGVKFHSVET
jgi:hypothetical protein